MSANATNEPNVIYDPNTGLLRLSGRSSMQEPKKFYGPIIEQIRSTTVPTFIIELKLEHFNTGTARSLYQLFKILEEKQTMGATILIRWYSDAGDEDHIELGEDLEAKTSLKFQYANY